MAGTLRVEASQNAAANLVMVAGLKIRRRSRNVRGHLNMARIGVRGLVSGYWKGASRGVLIFAAGAGAGMGAARLFFKKAI